MRRVLALVLVMAMVLSSGITGAFAATTVEIDSGVADSGGIVSVKITSSAASIKVGETTEVNVTVYVTQDSGEIPAVKWTSSNENVATVANDGKVTAVSAGKTTITVASAADSTKNDTVEITVEAAKSNVAAITSFKIDDAVGTITSNAIAITVPFGTAVTTLKPTVEISAKAAVSPTSGTATNFTSPVAYTVTAEDGSTKNVYTVTVTVAPVVPTTVEIEVATPPTALAVTEGDALSTSTLSGGKVIETSKTDAIAGTWAWTNSSATVSATGNFEAKFTPDVVSGTTFNPETLTAQIEVTANPVNPTPPTITSVTVTPNVKTIKVGEKQQLAAVVDSGSPTVQDVTWTSSADAIATVDATGLVTAVAKGEAIITATAKDTNVFDTATITVTAAPVVPTTVNISVATAPTASPVTKDAALSTSNLTGGKVIETDKTDAIAGTWAWTNSSAKVSATGNFEATFTPNAVANTTFNPTTLTRQINVTANPVNPTPPTITSVTVTPNVKTIKVGEKQQLAAVVDSGSPTVQDVTWTSSADATATVDATGLVTAVKAGTATITATAKDTNVFDTATITVEDTAAPTLSSIEITTPAKLVYIVGEPLDITGLVVTGTYSDNSEKVVPITATNITGFDSTKAVASQTLTITVGSVSVDYAVEINPAPVVPSVTSVTVSPKTASVEVKATKQLTATVVVVGEAAQTVTWVSDKTDIATVDASGKVTAKAVGTATITATSAVDKTKKDTATITVTEKTVTPPTPDEPLPGAKAELRKLIDTTNAEFKTVHESTNGANVPTNKKWATKAQREALIVAIENAKAVNNDQNTTQTAIDEISKELTTAWELFKTQMKPGTKAEKVDLSKLADALDAAEKVLDVVMGTDQSASNVAKGQKFVTIAELRAFTPIVNTAGATFTTAKTTAEADAAAKILTDALEAFNKIIQTGTYVPSSSSGSGGGSSSGGGTSTPPPSVDAPSSNVGGSGEVKSEDIKAETSKAVADAVKAAPGATANITVKNADNITPAALKEMAAAATAAGGKAQLMADSVVNGVVETRLYINPALAATLTAPIQLGVSTNSLEIDATKAKFASFANNIAVASFAQQGSFGMKIQAAVKLDLTTLNTKTLVFYSYDKATNTYVPIVAPAYTIDKNGYLHFSTTVGGDIIITDKALVKK